MVKYNLKFVNLGKRFSAKTIFSGVNLEISSGDLVCIVGESGRGKTVLLNIINLLEKHTEGEYYINDKPVNKLKKREIKMYKNKVFGRIFQDFKLIEEFTVFENIEIPLIYSKDKLSYSKRREKIETFMRKFNVKIDLDSRVKNLSGGEKQRISIIRGLINDPLIIIADEFSSALDIENRDFIIKIFTELAKEGKIVIAVSHDITATEYFDKVIDFHELIDSEH